MRAGKLRHRIYLMPTAESTSAASGEVSVVNSTGSAEAVWASIEPLQGRALEYAQAVSGEVSHLVTVRYISGIDSSYRVVFGSRTFEVESIIKRDERDIMLELYCREKGV